jgi:hypothetical protein
MGMGTGTTITDVDVNAANTARTAATRVSPGQLIGTAGEVNTVSAKPFLPLVETGVTELIGEDEAVAQNQYGGSIGVALATTASGTIEQITLINRENGDGAILKPSGVLYVLDADPAVAAADAAITAAEWLTVIGKFPISAADWGAGDATGASAQPVLGLPMAFHSLANLYFVWFHTSAVGFNDNAAHNETLHFNAWYRRES